MSDLPKNCPNCYAEFSHSSRSREWYKCGSFWSGEWAWSRECCDENARKVRDFDRWKAYAQSLEQHGDTVANKLLQFSVSDGVKRYFVNQWDKARKGRP